MDEAESKRGSRQILLGPLMLLLVFVALVTAGAAFAQLPMGGNPAIPPAQAWAQAQGNKPAQGTPTATATCMAVGTPGPWVSRANYPQMRGYMAVVSDGTNVYSFGGREWGGPY